MTCPFSSSIDAEGRVHMVACASSCIFFDIPTDTCLFRAIALSFAAVVKDMEESIAVQQETVSSTLRDQ